jgi:hypothetical protein
MARTSVRKYHAKAPKGKRELAEVVSWWHYVSDTSSGRVRLRLRTERVVHLALRHRANLGCLPEDELGAAAPSAKVLAKRALEEKMRVATLYKFATTDHPGLAEVARCAVRASADGASADDVLEAAYNNMMALV